MPEFKPLAGFSPNWEAVFVQIEHCAFTVAEVKIKKIQKNNSIADHFFIRSIYTAKIQTGIL